jgi:hypothetical protein
MFIWDTYEKRRTWNTFKIVRTEEYKLLTLHYTWTTEISIHNQVCAGWQEMNCKFERDIFICHQLHTISRIYPDAYLKGNADIFPEDQVAWAEVFHLLSSDA